MSYFKQEDSRTVICDLTSISEKVIKAYTACREFIITISEETVPHHQKRTVRTSLARIRILILLYSHQRAEDRDTQVSPKREAYKDLAGDRNVYTLL